MRSRQSQLGYWVGNVRALHRRGDLNPGLERARDFRVGRGSRAALSSKPTSIASRSFVAKHGWDEVTDALVIDGIKLGDWISNCGMRYRGGSLADGTIAGFPALLAAPLVV